MLNNSKDHDYLRKRKSMNRTGNLDVLVGTINISDEKLQLLVAVITHHVINCWSYPLIKCVKGNLYLNSSFFSSCVDLRCLVDHKHLLSSCDFLKTKARVSYTFVICFFPSFTDVGLTVTSLLNIKLHIGVVV